MHMPVKTVHTETAKHAYASIVETYGAISESTKYYHAGRGNWKKHSGEVTAEHKKFDLSMMRKPVNKMVRAKTKLTPNLNPPKIVKRKHAEYFGKDLSKEGKFKPGINLKRAAAGILKKHYPNTRFMLALSNITGNSGTVYIYWAGAPSETEIKLLHINDGRFGQRNMKASNYWVEYKHVDAGELERRIKFYCGLNGGQSSVIGPKVTKTSEMKFSLSALKAPVNKMVGRKTKIAPKAKSTPAIKHIEKPKPNLSALKASSKKLVGRTMKAAPANSAKPTIKHMGIYAKQFMKESPFSKNEVMKYNAYTFNPQDINEHFNREMRIIEKEAREKYPNGLPGDVLKALAYYRKALYEYHNEWGRASRVAPSIMVTGPTNYKGKPERADAIRRNANEKLDYAKKGFKTALTQSQIKIDREHVQKSYNVRKGDKVILHWTNMNRKYSSPATVERVNVNTLVGRLTRNVSGYDVGQEISVPMHSTGGNGWAHEGTGKPTPTPNKELIRNFHDSLKGLFKVGDVVDNRIYGKGTVIKINKTSMEIKITPMYQGDKGIRKVMMDLKTNPKIEA